MKNIHAKRSLAAAVLSIACASAAAESQFGLGAQLSPQDGVTIYLPIKVDGGVLIEPFFGYSSRSSSSSFGGEDFDSNKFTTRTFGVGMFGTRAVSETFDMYYGARIGFINVKETNTDYTTVPSATTTVTGSGYVIQPTIGAAYRATANVSFALEVALTYSKLDVSGDSNSQFTSVADTTNKNIETRSRFVARYMF